MVLKSVYYYTTVSESILNCAVLIDIQFELADKDKLAYAKLPLKALGAETVPLPSPDISSYYPEDEQPYKLKEFLDNQTDQRIPKVNVGAAGANVGIEGLGHSRERRTTTSSYISLKPMFDQQKCVLRWEFIGTKDADPSYPSQVKLLVIASKAKATDREVYFSFKLHLDHSLLVRLYDPGIRSRVKELWGKLTANEHGGWQFQIDGKYQDHLARQALENVQTSTSKSGRDYDEVGLYAAVKKLFQI